MNLNLALRKSYIAALVSIPYKGKNIPVYEEFLQVTNNKPVAKLNIGNVEVEAYIILLNQTDNDDSQTKCIKGGQASIQLQINTVFPLFKGGSITAEEISEVIESLLFTVDNRVFLPTIQTPFKIWKAKIIGTRNIPYTTDTNSCWITQLTINHWINN